MLSAFQEVQENEFEGSWQYTDFACRIANQKQQNGKKKTNPNTSSYPPNKNQQNKTTKNQGKKKQYRLI